MPTFPIYNKCNNDCIMCSNQKDCRSIDKKYFSLSYLTKRIERFRQGNKEFLDDYSDSFSMTGGEPTLHPEFINIMRKVDYFFPGIKINLLTNGRMFSYPDYAKEILNLGFNLELSVSIHGPNANLHDKITQTQNSFVQVVRGLENIIRFKKQTQSIGIRVVIHRLNYKFLPEIAKFIKNNFSSIDRLIFIFFEIEGLAIKNLKELKVTYNQLFPYVKKLHKFIRHFPDMRFYHFPLCVLPPTFFHYAWRTLPDFEVSFPNRCRKCTLKDLCLGVHKNYLRYIGNSEFKPIKNKFNIKKSDDWHHPILKATKKI